MIRRTPLWRSVAVLGAAGLILSACGGDDGDSEAKDTKSAAPQQASKIEKGDGTLVIGSVLPQTGSLAFLGPPEFAGVALGVEEVNEAGGVLGKPIESFEGDSGDTTTNIASQTVDRLLSQDSDVIVGAASSATSFTFIDKVTSAGAVQFSPANTSPDFTTYADKGLYFRTAPSDVLQGRVLGDLVLSEGNATVGILALQDPYGEGLADNTEKAITSGGGEVVEKVVYDPNAPEFSAEVSKIKAADPDAVVLIGFEESSKLIGELVKQNIGPQQGKKLYLVDGNLGNALGEKLPKGVLKDVKGTLPGAEATQAFRDRLLKIDPKLKDYSYAAESYDAVVLSALAAEAAGNDSGTAVASELVNVSKGGEKCDNFADCKALLDDKKDIDYDGVSGPVEFSDAGDPTEASIGIYTYNAQNVLTDQVEYRTGKL
ncbi:MAG: ABC transporter substrate-binding protein [Actinomycetes bacterium]